MARSYEHLKKYYATPVNPTDIMEFRGLSEEQQYKEFNKLAKRYIERQRRARTKLGLSTSEANTLFEGFTKMSEIKKLVNQFGIKKAYIALSNQVNAISGLSNEIRTLKKEKLDIKEYREAQIYKSKLNELYGESEHYLKLQTVAIAKNKTASMYGSDLRKRLNDYGGESEREEILREFDKVPEDWKVEIWRALGKDKKLSLSWFD